MMYRPRRVSAAIDAARATKLPIWFGASARRRTDGSLITYNQPEEIPLETIAAMIPPGGIDAAGIMHTGVEVVGGALEVVRRHFGGPLMDTRTPVISRCRIGVLSMWSRRSASRISAARPPTTSVQPSGPGQRVPLLAFDANYSKRPAAISTFLIISM